MNNFSIVLLSDRPDLKHQCCRLLGEEWKRSDTARLHSLSPNSKDLPDSLLLLEENDSTVKVVGHSRLSRVLEDNHGCWIASVIITLEKRGQGLGKYLMLKSEEYAKILGFTTAYLNTRDKQGFYEHLGYSYCAPVTSCKGNFFANGDSRLSNFRSHVLEVSKENERNCRANYLENAKIPSTVSSEAVMPPVPPPPPPPNDLRFNANCFTSATGQYWMKKYL